MRKLLDRLYDAAGMLAALFLVGTLSMVLLGIAGRLFNFHVPGTDSYAGYCMAAAGFLALAHTMMHGEHIRVTLILERLAGPSRRGLELWALVVGVLLAALLAFYSVRLAYQSWDFHDISTGNDATPLWIPQITMGVGAVILMIAFIDELVLEIRGERAQAGSDEALHHE